MNIYEHSFEVQYADLDTENKLSVYSFFKYFQEMGCLHAASLGYGINDIPRTGFAWILLDWKVQIFNYPKWNDKINIKTWPSKAELASCFRDFEMYNENGEKIAIATSRWVFFDVNKKRISKLTEEVSRAFTIVDKRVFNTEIAKLEDPAGSTFAIDYTVLKRDIDTNLHVNNLNYISIALEALPVEMPKCPTIEVMYKKQCILGDKIKCFYKKEETSNIVTIKSEDLGSLHAIAKFL